MKVTLKPLRFLVLAFIIVAVTGIYQPVKKYIEPEPDYTLLQEQLSSYLANEPGIYGVYLLDLKSGKHFGYNEFTDFHAASTFKLPMNIYLYQEFFKGNISLDEKLPYHSRHLEGGTGILQNTPPGGSYTIKELAEYSIIHSDNVATNILLERLDKPKVKDFMRSLGGVVVNDSNNVTCPRDLVLYMQQAIKLARSRQPEGRILLNNLYHSEFKDRIPQPLPSGIKVANKIGTWPPSHTYNDIAYVEHPDRPYILAITSKETPGYGESIPVIRHISKTIYDYQSSLNNIK